MAITWKGEDSTTGKEVVLRLRPDGTVEAVEPPQPPPVPEPVPFDPTQHAALVAADGSTWKVDGVDVARAADRLVVYTGRAAYAGVNRWGVDVLVSTVDGRVKGLLDREATGMAGFPVVLPSEVVVSGHGTAAAWLRAHVKVGQTVSWATVTEPRPAPWTGYGHCSVWAMLWPDSPRTPIATLASEVDEVRLAFAVGAGKLVGYGPYGGKDKLVAQLHAFEDARPGRFPSLSVGGGGYTISIPSVDAYVTAIEAIEKDLSTPSRPFRFGGLNWDWEADAFVANAAKCVEVSRKLKSLRGNGFYVSWSPNGTYKKAYRDALKANLDVVDEIAQQYYDSVVTLQDALVATKAYLDVGIPPEKVGVGMMLGSESTRWDLVECTAVMKAHATGLGVRISNLWEGSHPQTNVWAAAMAAVTRA